MAETLLTPSSIKLFGRLVTSLTFTNDTTQFGGNYFLQRQLAVNQSVDLTGTTYLEQILQRSIPSPSQEEEVLLT